MKNVRHSREGGNPLTLNLPDREPFFDIFVRMDSRLRGNDEEKAVHPIALS
jgi:hypothetical protein